tara:strand:+ start:80 stop:217 length:138 start_codon:yes stop_codon:yes gene_type:complete
MANSPYSWGKSVQNGKKKKGSSKKMSGPKISPPAIKKTKKIKTGY